MVDDEAQVRMLLRRAASDVAPAVPPHWVDLKRQHRRRVRVRTVGSAALAMAFVLAVAGIAQVVGGHRFGDQSRPAVPDKLAATPKVTVSQLAGYRWRTLPPAPIATRSDAAAVWSGHELIVWGGDRRDTILGDGASYNPSTRSWTKLPAAPISPRAGAVATWDGDSMLIWGAFPNPTNMITDGARFNPTTRTWHRLPAVSSAPGYAAAQLITVGTIAVLLRYPTAAAGADTTYGRTVRADAYDPHTNTWHRLPDFTAAPGHDILEVDALAIGQSVYLWTSWAHTVRDSPNGTKTTFGIDAMRLDALTENTWTTVATRPDQGLSARDPQAATHQIFLPQSERFCGGCAGPPLLMSAAVLVDPGNGHRTTIPSPRDGSSTQRVWTGAAVLGVGSHIGSQDRRTIAFSLKDRRWHALSPQPRTTQAPTVTIWTGHELIRWGDGGAPTAQPGIEFRAS